MRGAGASRVGTDPRVAGPVGTDPWVAGPVGTDPWVAGPVRLAEARHGSRQVCETVRVPGTGQPFLQCGTVPGHAEPGRLVPGTAVPPGLQDGEVRLLGHPRANRVPGLAAAVHPLDNRGQFQP